eukprot:GHVN01075609.1.p1 GENE.GHVN01075609.1~~GHVN01075609.1.p1  ORF type:complete len:246 (+),score=14.13 GHVN01075609.1:634-1371(+)
MEGLECAICFNAFTSSSSGNTDRTPLVFPCGHTLCQDCLTNIRRSSTQLLCPQCQRLAHSWSKNFCLIECIERQAKLNPPPQLLAAQSIPLRAIKPEPQAKGPKWTGDFNLQQSTASGPSSEPTGVVKSVEKNRITDVRGYYNEVWFDLLVGSGVGEDVLPLEFTGFVKELHVDFGFIDCDKLGDVWFHKRRLEASDFNICTGTQVKFTLTKTPFPDTRLKAKNVRPTGIIRSDAGILSLDQSNC